MEPDRDRILHLVVVGGGTAGWLAASLLAARHGAGQERALRVTLIESPNVPIIGVGEGTWPTMRGTLAAIGLSERDFLRNTGASFKQGSKFLGWVDGGPDDRYHHPFSPPVKAPGDALASWKAANGTPAMPFADWVGVQPSLADLGLAPKTAEQGDYEGILNYAYHLDAGAFAELLRRHATGRLGVVHRLEDVQDVIPDEEGMIAALGLASGEILHGDFFVDCTGFSARLLGQALGVPFRDVSDILFADRAIALQLPHDPPDAPIASVTLASAQRAGWIWDIGLKQRRGLGHVYASAFCSDDEAESALRSYAGPRSAAFPTRLLKFRCGYRETLWRKNCVAIGLSAGFFEPLEASAIMSAELMLDSLARLLPLRRDNLEAAAGLYNRRFSEFWPAIIDFLKLHYVLSRRQEPFWQANRAPGSIPDSLKNRLMLWRDHAPVAEHLGAANPIFSWLSYRHVLYGMGWNAPTVTESGQARPAERAAALAGFKDRLRAALPTNRALLSDDSSRQVRAGRAGQSNSASISS